MKPCEWAYLSKETIDMTREIAGARMRRQVIQKYAREHGLLPPKTMRKISWRLMIKAMPREVARFYNQGLESLRSLKPGMRIYLAKPTSTTRNTLKSSGRS
jgi:excinuclease UvrABC helicase subunit UvrB